MERDFKASNIYIDLYGHPHLIDTGGTPQTVQPDGQDPFADGAMS